MSEPNGQREHSGSAAGEAEVAGETEGQCSGDQRRTSPLLSVAGAVEGTGPDAGVAAHYGAPVQEQRALSRGTALVDLSHYAVVTVSGPDRLSWLTTLSSQQVTDMAPGDSSELLLLDIAGRVEHAPAITDDGETAWLITEPEHGPVLAQWLESMKFMLRVEITDATDSYAVLGSTVLLPEIRVGSAGAGLQVIRWQDPWPRIGQGAVSYAEIEEQEHPGWERPWHLSVVPRAQLTEAVAAWEQEGLSLAGVLASEALRVAAWRPRLAAEVDAKAIPHELDLIRTAVHMSKGCYKGQETVARVHNLGHPPRRLVFLHLDGTEHTLPAVGSPVLAPAEGISEDDLLKERAVGVLTSVARHHEAGPIGLALVKRKVDPQLQLVVRDMNEGSEDGQGNPAAPSFYAAAQEPIVRPDAGKAVGRPQGNFVRRPR